MSSLNNKNVARGLATSSSIATPNRNYVFSSSSNFSIEKVSERSIQAAQLLQNQSNPGNSNISATPAAHFAEAGDDPEEYLETRSEVRRLALSAIDSTVARNMSARAGVLASSVSTTFWKKRRGKKKMWW